MVMTKKFMAVFMVAMLMFFGLGSVHVTKVHAATGGTTTTTATTGTVTSDLPFDPDKKAEATDVTKTGTAVAGIVGTMYTFAKYISALIFGVAVIVIVWAGFKYATSQGEQKTMEQAKMQIIAAGIGIGVALLAMVIVSVFKQIYLS